MWSFSSIISGKYRRIVMHLNTAFCVSQCWFFFLFLASSQALLFGLDRKHISVKEVHKKRKGTH